MQAQYYRDNLDNFTHFIIVKEKRQRRGGAPLLITRETDYALRILRVFAPGSCLTVGEIWRRIAAP